MHEGCPHVCGGSGSDCAFRCERLPTPAPLLAAVFAQHKCSTSSLRAPCSASPSLQDEGLESFWPAEIWHGTGGRKLPVDGTSARNRHGNGLIFFSVAVRPAVHTVTEWTG